jgi:SAM-dependent methyltransferase
MTKSQQKTFSENDIRPYIYEAKIKEALQNDLKWLHAQEKKFVTIGCPACDAANYQDLFKKYDFNFVECHECKTVFMNPRATPFILNSFYSNSALYKIWNTYVFPSSATVRRNEIFKPRVKRILEVCDKYDVDKNCLVEVGSGFGLFCEEIVGTNCFDSVIAIEPEKHLAETCRSKGLYTIENSIENINYLEDSPNVVVAFEVIEHLFSPYSFLKSCKRLMASNSIIVVTCPNFQGFDISTLGLNSDSIDAEHINLFNPFSISMLFERSGFAVLECLTPGKIDTDIVRNKILNGAYDVSDQFFLKTVLIERWDEFGSKFQTFLSENNLSSHMWLVAKKK